jgi:SecD/SecF fusion protein
MNAKNLPLKILLFVVVPAALCVWSIVGRGLKPGLDLAGGYVMEFVIRTREAELEGLRARRERVQAALDTATSEAKRSELTATLKQIDAKISQLESAGGMVGNLSERMAEVIKERIDPQGLRNVQVRPVGRDRIEIRMPAASEASQRAGRAYGQAVERLIKLNVQRSEIRRVIEASPADRPRVIEAIAGRNEQMAEALRELGSARDAAAGAGARREQAIRRFLQADTAGREAVLQTLADRAPALVNALRRRAARVEPNAPRAPAAKPAELADALLAAENAVRDKTAAFRSRREALRDGNISRARLESVLRQYVSPKEAEAIRDKVEVETRRERYRRGLRRLREKCADQPRRLEQLEQAVKAYEAWADVRQHLESPDDLKRLIRKAGVLEFRIAPVPAHLSTDRRHLRVPEQVVAEYRRRLQEEGPEAIRDSGDNYAWFPVHSPTGMDSFALADYGGKTYILLANEPGLVMLQEPGKVRWQLDAYPTSDRQARRAVGFDMDETGARLFARLTAANRGRHLAILVDDEVHSAPVIRATISKSGIIEGRYTRDEVADLVRTLDAGSLPGRLDPNPVADEQLFGPAIGRINRQRGVQAARWGLVAVAVFILGYYLLAGGIADLALALNVVFVLGAMSLMSAVFTLPGIAGVILTIGIAVDANVLIFERLREEQQRSQSVRMALKNAYERAFSAIFDANVTTLITCLILGWVGTPEVRGFAITLGLGIVFSLFTALVVTRWVFQILLDRRLIRRPIRMGRLLGVPSVNWIGKRHYFWGVSGVLIVLGVASLVWQGRNVLGIEFSAGTKATFALRPNALIAGRLPNDEVVREHFEAGASRLGYERLRDTAVVKEIIEPQAVAAFFTQHDRDGDGRVTAGEWLAGRGNTRAYFDRLDAGGDGVLSREEVSGRLPSRTFEVTTTETEPNKIKTVVRQQFGQQLESRTECRFDLARGRANAELGVQAAPDGVTAITPELSRQANLAYRSLLEDFEGGVVMIVSNVQPAISVAQYRSRIGDARRQPDFDFARIEDAEVIGLGQAASDQHTQFAVLASPADPAALEVARTRQPFKDSARRWLVEEPLQRGETVFVTAFSPTTAAQQAQLAVVAIVLSCAAIVGYLWFRFGSVQWGLAAMVCLLHDVVIVVGLIAASGWLHTTLFGRALAMDSFKIDLAMVAAILTVIGYSVNDTIVVFDRIRENRGKLATVSPQVINTSINQTLSRTLLTSGTTFIVVFIMYVWGGPGIHPFNYALLAGILFGTYSSVAVASPLLLGFKQAVVVRTTGRQGGS